MLCSLNTVLCGPQLLKVEEASAGCLHVLVPALPHDSEWGFPVWPGALAHAQRKLQKRAGSIHAEDTAVL